MAAPAMNPTIAAWDRRSTRNPNLSLKFNFLLIKKQTIYTNNLTNLEQEDFMFQILKHYLA